MIASPHSRYLICFLNNIHELINKYKQNIKKKRNETNDIIIYVHCFACQYAFPSVYNLLEMIVINAIKQKKKRKNKQTKQQPHQKQTNKTTTTPKDQTA